MPTWIDKILNSQSVQLALAALAFLIALWLVVVIARMLMGGRLRLPGGRTRQARLGIVDAFDLDRQRQLIIVRRDNTEHLIMIGGPNDLVIESEIVRVESRDYRDTRRDKGFDPTGDARIPAPFGVPSAEPSAPTSVPRQDEPLLPMPLPQQTPEAPALVPEATITAGPVEPAPPRGPTFPLPSRRPVAPVAPTPERRPPPLPERVSRGDDLPPPPFAPEPPALIVPPPLPAPSAPPSDPMPTSEATPVALPADIVPPPRPIAPTRPAPFLKPLPPRPPIRPLKRVTPQAEPVQPAAPSSDATPPKAVTPPAAPKPAPETPPKAATAPPPAAPEPAPAAPPTADVDALESLEEEMAKLLGRG